MCGTKWTMYEQKRDLLRGKSRKTGKSERGKKVDNTHQSSFFILPSRTAYSGRAPHCIVTQMMAVSSFVFGNGCGPHPSGQSASYNLKPFNYSAVAPAFSIIKGFNERPVPMFPKTKGLGPCVWGSKLSHGHFRAEKISNSENLHFLKISEYISENQEFFRKFQKFQNFFDSSPHKWRRGGTRWLDLKSHPGPSAGNSASHHGLNSSASPVPGTRLTRPGRGGLAWTKDNSGCPVA